MARQSKVERRARKHHRDGRKQTRVDEFREDIVLDFEEAEE